MNSELQFKFCPSCGVPLQESVRFCAQCGANLQSFRAKEKLPAKGLLAVAITSVISFALLWYWQTSLSGHPPKEAFKEQKRGNLDSVELDGELKQLKEAAEKSPKDKQGWVALAQAVSQRLTMKDAPRELVFEAIGALRHILDIDPKDKDALLTMAEISFQQQAFAKAAEFYQQYLAIMPDDLDMRARYASSLSFVGRFDDSLRELNQILAKQPDHFHALAYSAVTYAEMGNNKKAKELGKKALDHAPNQEARERFGAFLDTLDKPNQPNKPEQQNAVAANSGTFDATAEAVIAHVKNNPVAGRKFVNAEMLSPDTLKISLDNFPMAQMPPFVKDKFINGIREKAFAAGSKLKEVVLFDSAANSELMRVKK